MFCAGQVCGRLLYFDGFRLTLETVEKHLQVKSCFMVQICCFEVSRLSQWAEVVQSLGWTWCKVCFCSGDKRFSAIRPCCAATTVNECQTFIYTWARVWYSRGHCGSLANPLPPSLKLRGVVFLLLLFLFFFNPQVPAMEVCEIIFHNTNCQKANDPWLLLEW